MHTQTRYRYLPGIILFLLALMAGLFIFRDYGISWDEPIQRDLGIATYNYVFKGDPALKTAADRALGTGFELPLIILERALKLNDSRDIYLVRHIATHIFFLLSLFCGYILALRVFKNQFIACVAFLLFIFEPRIYAHSFFNSKDIPFLSACLISLLVSQVAFEKRTKGWYLLLGIAWGYATSIRSMGVIFLPCIALFFITDLFSKRMQQDGKQPAVTGPLLFVAGYMGMLYLSWPFLWSAPVDNFLSSFHAVTNLNTGVKKELFAGDYLNYKQLDLGYIPKWFAITVPELWLFAGIAGFVWLTVAVVRKPGKFLLNTPERNFVLYLTCFAMPVVIMSVFHGININDWRHLYFIYPPFVMLVLFVISKLAAGNKKIIVQGLCILQLGLTGCFMVKNHPFQQVYFNSLVSHEQESLNKNYELDYWGCSYKQGLEYLVATNRQVPIRIALSNEPLLNNLLILKKEDRQRVFVIDDLAQTDYILIDNHANCRNDFPYAKVLYSIKVLNSSIMCVYKLH